MIGFYDEIHREPVAFLERLCTFIGAGPLPAQVRELAGSRVNSSARGTPMPTAVARYAAQRFHAEAQTLAGLVEGPARRSGLRRSRPASQRLNAQRCLRTVGPPIIDHQRPGGV